MFTADDKIRARTLRTVTDTQVSVPAPERRVRQQFRRFGGCPICNLHLRDVARRSDEIQNAGVTEVVLFRSDPDRLRQYVADIPFAMVADPERKLCKEFGVESSLLSVLHLGAIRTAVRGIRHSTSATKC